MKARTRKSCVKAAACTFVFCVWTFFRVSRSRSPSGRALSKGGTLIEKKLWDSSTFRVTRCPEVAQVFTVAYVGGGAFGNTAVRRLFAVLLPQFELNIVHYMSGTIADIIVEGAPQFIDFSLCPHPDIPWAQFVSEPGHSYDDGTWCNHSQSPVFRLDTSLYYYNRTHADTTFIWTPYAGIVVDDILHDKRNARRRSDFESFISRPYRLAWIASNCDTNQRILAFSSMLEQATEMNASGVHSLGSCIPNTNFTIPPRDQGWMHVVNVYKNYRFVLAIESHLETGYVTEKIVSAMAAGAIPVYYGDADAARMLFADAAYLDVKDIWATLGVFVDDERPTAEHWKEVMKYIIDLEEDRRKLLKFLTAARQRHTTLQTMEGYPNVPFPSHDLPENISRKLRTKLLNMIHHSRGASGSCNDAHKIA